MDTMNRPYLKVRSSILSKPVDVHMGELDELASSRPLEIPEQFSITGWPMGTRFTAP